ncbi:MAG: AIR synthase-related protein, partial [Gammaproteobacteria bacterium]
RGGNVAAGEMYRTFNCGIGMAVVVAADDARAALDHLGAQGETACIIGRVEQGDGKPGVTLTG